MEMVTDEEDTLSPAEGIAVVWEAEEQEEAMARARGEMTPRRLAEIAHVRANLLDDENWE